MYAKGCRTIHHPLGVLCIVRGLPVSRLRCFCCVHPGDGMIALLQRVNEASVTVAGVRIAAIGKGLLVFVGMTRTDEEMRVRRTLERILGYRVFPDKQGRMNVDLVAAGGGLLLVPQFTLAADTRKGRRPGFDPAAPPAQAEVLFTSLCEMARKRHAEVACGRFGADMRVALVNDGPVTFVLSDD